MGSLSLLAASVVVALLGFGWINALKDGVFDFFSFFRSDNTEEILEDPLDELERDDAARKESLGEETSDEPIAVDPEFDDELNALDNELDALLQDAENELNSLEGEL
jgi:hypothetical protein